MRTKIKAIWLEYESKIVLIAGLALIGIISFEAGLIKGQKIGQGPIIIEKAGESQTCGSTGFQEPAKAQKLAQKGSDNPDGMKIPPQNCPFLGSKNSNKYHLPGCSSAKRIKPENVTCFSSEDEAKSKGYLPDKGCIK